MVEGYKKVTESNWVGDKTSYMSNSYLESSVNVNVADSLVP